jgi:hypothetical protein
MKPKATWVEFVGFIEEVVLMGYFGQFVAIVNLSGIPAIVSSG